MSPDQYRPTILTEDNFPDCPHCGCTKGTLGRLVRYADGTIVCNDCLAHMFFSPTEKPMADPTAKTKEQRMGLPLSAKQVRDAARKANPK